MTKRPTTPKRPVNVPNFDEYLHQLGFSIRTRRANLAKGMLELVEIIDHLRESKSPDEISSFLKECGLSDDETSTYLAFGPRLQACKEILSGQPLGYDALRALANTDDEGFTHAIGVLEAGGRVGKREFRLQREIPEATKISDRNDLIARRDDKIKRTFEKRASLDAELFGDAVQRLYAIMVQYEGRRLNIESYRARLQEQEFLADEDAGRPEAWPDFEASGERYLEGKRREISTLAAKLLKEFDELFPEAFVPIEEWVKVAGDDKLKVCFAESRHVLDCLATERFGAEFPSSISHSYHWDALGSISFLAGVRGTSNLSRRNDPRPVRELQAINIFVASGAEGLGFDEAGFRIAATFCSVPRTDETIQANRRDWQVKALSRKRGPGRRIFGEQERSDAAQQFCADIVPVVGDKKIHLLSGTLAGEPFKESGRGCVSAWNIDPTGGVIGVQF